MSFFESIKGAIWEQDPNECKSQPPPQSVKGTTVTRPVSATPNTVVQPVFGGINQEMVDALRTIVTNRKTAFTALEEQAVKLESIILDPNVRMKAAFATVNRPAKDVIQAIDIHISDINGEVMKFKNHSASEKNTQVTALRSQSKSLTDGSATINAQIADLETKIAQLREKLTTDAIKANELSTQADSVESKLANAEREFETAASSIITELETQKHSFLSTVGENK